MTTKPATTQKEDMIPMSEVQKLLEAKMDEMSRIFEDKIRNMNSQPVVEIQSENKNSDRIRSDDYVEVISLCPVPLNLSTQGNGRGLVFKFAKFGDKKSILYKDLTSIIENHRSFLEGGYFYILDERVIKTNGLDEVYSRILTKDNIVSLLEEGDEASVQMFKSCNDKQKSAIVEMVIQKLIDDIDAIDISIVDKISRISGINIREKVDFSKDILESENE